MVDLSYFNKLILLISIVGCGGKSIEQANQKGIPIVLSYTNLIEKVRWPAFENIRITYEDTLIDTNVLCDKLTFKDINYIPIDSFVHFDFLTGVSKMKIIGETKQEIENQFRSYSCYYLGNISSKSVLILLCNKIDNNIIQKIYLFNLNDNLEVASIVFVAHMLDFTEHISKAYTRIIDINHFEYVEEEVLSDIIIVGVEKEIEIPIVMFKIDEVGFVQIVQ